MSVQAQTAVINHSRARGSVYTVLLMLANHAHADGTNAYPSVETLAREARVSVRTVQGALQHLIAMGEVSCTPREGPRGTNIYSILLPIQGTPAESAPRKVRHDTPQILQGTPQRTADNPADSAPKPSLTVIEPSVEPRGRAPARTSHTRPAPKPSPPPSAPASFEPDEESRAYALAAGCDPDREKAAFLNHYHKNRVWFPDPQAAFRSWIDKAPRFRRDLPACQSDARASPSEAGLSKAALRSRQAVVETMSLVGGPDGYKH